MTDSNLLPDLQEENIGEAIRIAAGLDDTEGPSDIAIKAAVTEFVGQFDYWFTRVVAEAVVKYRALVISRINVLIRPIELKGLGSSDVATRLVSDYVNRNFVTAGGWAIERMAIAVAGATGGSKASSRGIDLERSDDNGNRHLYVIKSGKVTRNSDILSKLKQHARDAEKLIKQGGSKVAVFPNYVVAVGATSSSFEDGIRRPSSAEFWAEVMGLTEEKALALVAAIAMAAGKQVTKNADAHIHALVTLVRSYIDDPTEVGTVDWPFLFRLTMTTKAAWKSEDVLRHNRALAALNLAGYTLNKTARRKDSKSVSVERKSLAKKKGRVPPKRANRGGVA